MKRKQKIQNKILNLDFGPMKDVPREVITSYTFLKYSFFLADIIYYFIVRMINDSILSTTSKIKYYNLVFMTSIVLLAVVRELHTVDDTFL